MCGISDMGMTYLENKLVRTPVFKFEHGTKTIWIKDETKQTGGSFKFRGPDHFFEHHPEVKSVVTASSGNHAIGVSLAARKHNATATIYIPEATPQQKRQKIKAAGGHIIPVQGTYEDSLQRAKTHAIERGETLLPSYDHPMIIQGNRGLYQEAMTQMPCTPTLVAVPVGGGGCVSAAVQEFTDGDQTILAAEYAPYARVQKLALDGFSGDIQTNYRAEPSTEGIAIKTLGTSNRAIIKSCAALTVSSVSLQELSDACRLLYSEFGIIAELGASAGMAAALTHDGPEPTDILCIVTGGNIDASVHADILAAHSKKVG